jgi:hypothetical protein
MSIAQNCGICKDPICTCDDFESKLDACKVAYKCCTKCDKHYDRCACKEPYFSVKLCGVWHDEIAISQCIHRTIR